MSIASNVILENTKLGTTKTKLRNKLTENNIWWDNSLTIFELAERLIQFVFGMTITDTVQSDTVPINGFEYSVTVANGNVPVDWWVNETHSVIRTDSNGKSQITVPYVKDGNGTVICKVGRKEAINVNYNCVSS